MPLSYGTVLEETNNPSLPPYSSYIILVGSSSIAFYYKRLAAVVSQNYNMRRALVPTRVSPIT